MALEVQRGIFSWMNYMDVEETTLVNDQKVLFFGSFEAPDIPDSVGDIEYVLQDGDRLDSLAQEYYDEELLHWVIAVRNGMDLPDLDIKVGTKIVIPDPDLIVSRYIRK